MQTHSEKNYVSYFIPTGAIFIILGGLLLYAFIKINSLSGRVDSLAVDLASTTLALSLNTHQLSKNVTDLTNQTVGLSSTLTSAQQNLDVVKFQVGDVKQAVGSISGTVNNLQKLAQVDPQLLKKYSKVYFLNENYIPAHLVTIPSEYTYSSARQEYFLTESWPYLKNLIDNAKAEGLTLYIKSGYRSYSEQKSLKSTYSVIYGAGTANRFSADQGYSEHQLGTTLDFIAPGLNGNLVGFDTTKEYKWLLDNAHTYGFVLSYPKGNKYYVYEPWHWRYVGVKLATYLHEKNLHFYDLDQRTIDEYLVTMFD